MLATSFTTYANVDCAQASMELRNIFENERTTLIRLSDYLATNAHAWKTAHNLINSGKLTKRSYNGNFNTNARGSEHNQREMTSRANHFREASIALDQFLSECVK